MEVGRILPYLVVRLERGEVIDVSAEFWESYKREIEQTFKQLSKDELRKFRSLTDMRDSMDFQSQLHDTKIRVLKIVLGYLYGGREEEARKALGNLWPPWDIERIWNLILKTRQAEADRIHVRTTKLSQSPTPQAPRRMTRATLGSIACISGRCYIKPSVLSGLIRRIDSNPTMQCADRLTHALDNPILHRALAQDIVDRSYIYQPLRAVNTGHALLIINIDGERKFFYESREEAAQALMELEERVRDFEEFLNGPVNNDNLRKYCKKLPPE